MVLFSMLLSSFYLIKTLFYFFFPDSVLNLELIRLFFHFSPEGGLLVVIMLNVKIFKLYESFIRLRNRNSSKIILLNLVLIYMDLHIGS